MAGDARNLRLAGTFLKSCLTCMEVPIGTPADRVCGSDPNDTLHSVPWSASTNLDRAVTSATAAMEGRASPRNPRVGIATKSELSSTLLVANRWNAVGN